MNNHVLQSDQTFWQPLALKVGPSHCLHTLSEYCCQRPRTPRPALSCFQNKSSSITLVFEHTVRSPPARTSPAEFTLQGEAEERSVLSPQRRPIAAELLFSGCYVHPYLPLSAGAPLCHQSHHAVANLAVAPLCRRHDVDRPDQAVANPCTSQCTPLQNLYRSRPPRRHFKCRS